MHCRASAKQVTFVAQPWTWNVPADTITGAQLCNNCFALCVHRVVTVMCLPYSWGSPGWQCGLRWLLVVSRPEWVSSGARFSCMWLHLNMFEKFAVEYCLLCVLHDMHKLCYHWMSLSHLVKNPLMTSVNALKSGCEHCIIHVCLCTWHLYYQIMLMSTIIFYEFITWHYVGWGDCLFFSRLFVIYRTYNFFLFVFFSLSVIV